MKIVTLILDPRRTLRNLIRLVHFDGILEQYVEDRNTFGFKPFRQGAHLDYQGKDPTARETKWDG